jgi:hypothetical protein
VRRPPHMTVYLTDPLCYICVTHFKSIREQSGA